MQTNNDTFVNKKVGSVYLLVDEMTEAAFNFSLEKNAIVLAGSGRNCGLQLAGQGVQPLHCRISLGEDGTVLVQDWNTDGKTIVNGQPVVGEQPFHPGDELQIGLHRISLAFAADLSGQFDQGITKADETSNREDLAEVHNSIDTAKGNSSAGGDPSELVPPANVLEYSDQRDAFEYLLNLDDESLDDDLPTAEPSLGGMPEYSAGYEFESGAAGVSPAATEELELLRTEVEQLRYELAERDAQHEMLSAQANSSCQDDECMDDDDAVRLVNRLEELLQELQSTDERVRGLEELLRVSDQATQAEQEERSHLERWVSEIERRVANREAESTAEVQRISMRFQEAQQRLELTELQLKKVIQLKTGDSGEPGNDFLEKLATRVAELQNKLGVALKENEALRTQNLQDEAGARATLEYQQMEQALLQVQVESSREKAELARERAELERLKEEVQTKLEAKHPLNEADSRIRAMRQHLQEIHDREKNSPDANKQTGLGGRIANLLGRVGR